MCNGYLGLDPGYNKNTIGIRSNFRHSSLEIPASSTFKLLHGEHSTENGDGSGELEASFLCVELFAKIYPTSKIMLIANLPYQFNSLTFGNSEGNLNAPGDITILGFYQLANTMSVDSNSVRHRLFGGLGIKLPTGKSSGTSVIDIPMAHELNSGTGSTDYLVAISYIGKYKKLGWNLDLNFKYNTESKNDYLFGHTLNVTPRIFYETRIKTVKVLPHIGASYELGDYDYYEGVKQVETGGSTFWGSAGVDFYFGRFSVTSDVRLPFHQELNGNMPEDKYWLFGSVNFHF